MQSPQPIVAQGADEIIASADMINGANSQHSQRPARSSRLALVVLVMGIVLLLYPVVSTIYNNVRQHQFAQQYASSVGDFSEDEKESQLEAARHYNTTITGTPILDPYLDKVATNPESAAYEQYMSQLDLTSVMARVRVPSAGIDLPVYHNTTDDVLKKGVGHLYGTALPVGGEGTHAVLTSHTGIAEATLFDHLTDVTKGDLIFVDVLGTTLAYRVDRIDVVLPNDISRLKSTPGHDYLTLFTCTPYGINSHRLLVRAERVIEWDDTTQQLAENDAAPIAFQKWMIGSLSGVLVGILILILILRHRRRTRSHQK